LKDYQGQFFIHISKNVLKALFYKALSTFLPTILSSMAKSLQNTEG